MNKHSSDSDAKELSQLGTSSSDLAANFLSHMTEHAPLYAKHLKGTALRHPALFAARASELLHWAALSLGEDYQDVLRRGYTSAVNEANLGQARYERSGVYENKSYHEVAAKTYLSQPFMELYHWGIFTTHFAWEHHLLLTKFFEDEFLPCLDKTGGRLLDLGCGSGIWSLMAITRLRNWQAHLVDISPHTASITRRCIESLDLSSRMRMEVADALSFATDPVFDAALSCLLIEHLEQPIELLKQLHRAIPGRGYCFLVAALTAAETDHIFEFRSESELCLLSEKAGFRVLAFKSLGPSTYPSKARFLPRVLGLILQKKLGDIW